MPYNPNVHHHKSIRLKGYNYSQAGLYFITICLKDRDCLFGKIENGEMILNDAGKMVEKWYCESENKFPYFKYQDMVVMPDHFHWIVENVGQTPISTPIFQQLKTYWTNNPITTFQNTLSIIHKNGTMTN